MVPKRIAQYTRMMRKEGISSLKIGDVVITLGPVPQDLPKLKEDLKPEQQYSQEDILFWSSGN